MAGDILDGGYKAQQDDLLGEMSGLKEGTPAVGVVLRPERAKELGLVGVAEDGKPCLSPKIQERLEELYTNNPEELGRDTPASALKKREQLLEKVKNWKSGLGELNILLESSYGVAVGNPGGYGYTSDAQWRLAIEQAIEMTIGPEATVFKNGLYADGRIARLNNAIETGGPVILRTEEYKALGLPPVIQPHPPLQPEIKIVPPALSPPDRKTPLQELTSAGLTQLNARLSRLEKAGVILGEGVVNLELKVSQKGIVLSLEKSTGATSGPDVFSVQYDPKGKIFVLPTETKMKMKEMGLSDAAYSVLEKTVEAFNLSERLIKKAEEITPPGGASPVPPFQIHKMTPLEQAKIKIPGTREAFVSANLNQLGSVYRQIPSGGLTIGAGGNYHLQMAVLPNGFILGLGESLALQKGAVDFLVTLNARENMLVLPGEKAIAGLNPGAYEKLAETVRQFNESQKKRK